LLFLSMYWLCLLLKKLLVNFLWWLVWCGDESSSQSMGGWWGLSLRLWPIVYIFLQRPSFIFFCRILTRSMEWVIACLPINLSSYSYFIIVP
jgi:hypothetical protein